MRTTLTIEDDVFALINQAKRRSGKSLKQVINDGLRIGLAFKSNDTNKKGGKVHFPTFDCGQMKVSNLDNISEILSIFEGELQR